MKKVFAFLVLAAFLPALVSAQEGDPYYDDDYWGDWLWEAEGLVVTEDAPPRRLQEGSVAVEVISAEEIQNSTAVTLVDVLTNHGLVLGDTGHHAGEHSGDRIVMQGVDGANVTILINVRRVPGRQGDNVIAATLPLSNVERIEVIRGPQSVRHGSAVGGVINIITKEPEDRVTVSTSFTNRFLLPHNDPDTDNDSQAGFDPGREQNLTAVVGFPIGRSRNSIDVEASRGSFHFAEDGITSLLPQFTRGRVGFESILPLTDDAELSYGISGMMLRSEHQTALATGAANHINRRDYVRLEAHIGIDWALSDEVELGFGVSNSYYHREFDRFRHVGGGGAGAGEPGEWRENTLLARENQTAVDVTGSWLFRPALRFTGGVEGQWQVVESERFTGETIVWQNYELFLEAEHFVEGRYSVALGVRGMFNPRFDPMAVPRLSGALHLGRGVRLLAGGGMGYRLPNFVNLYANLVERANVGYGGMALGNPDLRPETSVGTNLGLEWTGRRAFVLVNTFHTELWNQIDAPSVINPAPGQPGHIEDLPAAGTIGTPGRAPYGRWRTWRNLDRTFRTGVDAETRVNLPLHLFASAGYSWVFGWDRDLGEEITLSPPHAVRGRVGIDLPSPNFTANVNFRWASSFSSRGGNPPYSEQWIDPDDTSLGTRVAPGTMLDFESVFTMGFFMAHRLNDNWRITFAADNLFAGTNAHGNVTAAQTPTFSVGVVFTH